MAYLPELTCISVSMVGKGEGPAFIIEMTERIEKEKGEYISPLDNSFDEGKSTDALKMFIDCVVVNEHAFPYTKNVDLAVVGLEAKGVTPGPVAYCYDGSSDTFAVVGAFWTWYVQCLCSIFYSFYFKLVIKLLIQSLDQSCNIPHYKSFTKMTSLLSVLLSLLLMMMMLPIQYNKFHFLNI
jgi:hypothetical protein